MTYWRCWSRDRDSWCLQKFLWKLDAQRARLKRNKLSISCLKRISYRCAAWCSMMLDLSLREIRSWDGSLTRWVLKLWGSTYSFLEWYQLNWLILLCYLITYHQENQRKKVTSSKKPNNLWLKKFIPKSSLTTAVSFSSLSQLNTVLSLIYPARLSFCSLKPLNTGRYMPSSLVQLAQMQPRHLSAAGLISLG